MLASHRTIVAWVVMYFLSFFFFFFPFYFIISVWMWLLSKNNCLSSVLQSHRIFNRVWACLKGSVILPSLLTYMSFITRYEKMKKWDGGRETREAFYFYLCIVSCWDTYLFWHAQTHTIAYFILKTAEMFFLLFPYNYLDC